MSLLINFFKISPSLIVVKEALLTTLQKRVMWVALAAIIAGGVLLFFLNRIWNHKAVKVDEGKKDRLSTSTEPQTEVQPQGKQQEAKPKVSVEECVSQAVKVLDSSDTDEIKTKKLTTLINTLNSLKDSEDEDEHCLFAKMLAEKCSADHMKIIFDVFLACSTRQRIGESFLQNLLFFRLNELDEIRSAFEIYWKNWKQFDQSEEGCFVHLLHYFTPKTLPAACEVIPAGQKEEILAALAKTHSYNDCGVEKKFHLHLSVQDTMRQELQKWQQTK